MKYRLIKFYYIDGYEVQEELGEFTILPILNSAILESEKNSAKCIAELMTENTRKEECWVRYEIYPEDNTKLVGKLRQLVENSGHGYLEVHCPGNPPVLEEEDVLIDLLNGLTRNCGKGDEMTIEWDNLEDSDIDFLKDYIPELNS
mgnify:FL=1